MDKKTHEIHENLNPTKITNHTVCSRVWCWLSWDDVFDILEAIIIYKKV